MSFATRIARILFLLALLCGLRPVPATTAQTLPPGMDAFDELQRNVWYLPTTDGAARLYVTSMGQGPTVVVLHGGPGNDFHYLVPALRPLAKQYRFVLFDQRGSLFSPVREKDVEKIGLDVLVDDLETLRAALGEPQLVLLGHSFGTILAQAYYRKYPEHVAGLVLAASAPPQADSMRTFMSHVREAHQRMKTLRSRPEVAAALCDAGVASGEAGAPLSPRAASVRSKIGLASVNLVKVERWRELYGGGVYYKPEVDDAIGNTIPETYDLGPALARRSVPIAVLQGDQDYLDPAANSWRPLAMANPAIEVNVLSGAGHYSWIDAPAEFTRMLSHGLARVPRGR